jgi:hypothetical protein
MTTIRKCRIKNCDANHPNHLFCCRHHWFQIPVNLRDDIWNTYQDGAGIFTVEYLQAAENAEAYLENRNARDMSGVLSD